MHLITAFISWTCYGQWLHGDARGSVDPEHNLVDTPWLPPDPPREVAERERMAEAPYEMDADRRKLVLEAIIGVCKHRGWTLHAVHVRARHVHVVVSGAQAPERMMNDFKAYASRALNAAGFDTPDRKRWTRHGSTRYINDPAYLEAASNYVLHKQGDPMQRWPEPEPPLPDGRGSLANDEPDEPRP
jgi:REP element-mobilizing transposase RayT